MKTILSSEKARINPRKEYISNSCLPMLLSPRSWKSLRSARTPIPLRDSLITCETQVYAENSSLKITLKKDIFAWAACFFCFFF